MGWAPNISFKLRDDEFTLGKLIIGKEIIQDVEKLIIALRNGVQIDSSFYQQLFNGFVFIDEEFEQVKEDFEQVKIDYAYFRDVLKSKMRFDFAGMLAHAETIANYAIGSATWLERYGEMKQQAGEMYRRLKVLGVDFGDRAAEYEKRYAHVKESNPSNGAIVSALQDQYKMDVLNGVPDAAERYLNAAKALGPVEAARAEANIRFGNASAIAGKGEVVSKAGTGVIIDGTDVEPEETPAPVQNKVVSIDTDMMIQKINDIYGTGDMVAVLAGLGQVNQLIESWCKDVGIQFPFKYAANIKECGPNTTLGEIKQNEKYIIDMLTFSANKSLFDTDPREMLDVEWKLFALPKGYTPKDVPATNDTSTSNAEEGDEPILREDKAVQTSGLYCTVDNLVKTFEEMKLIKDMHHKALCVSTLVFDIARHVLPCAGIGDTVAHQADQFCGEFNAGHIPDDQMVSECDFLIQFISKDEARTAIDRNPYYKNTGFVTE